MHRNIIIFFIYIFLNLIFYESSQFHLYNFLFVKKLSMFVIICCYSLTCCIQGETRRTFATIRAIRVNTSASTLTDTTVEFTLVDVRAALAIHFRVALRTFAQSVVADFARAAPGHTD